MPINPTNEINQIDTAIGHLNEIKQTLFSQNPLDILHLYSHMKEKNIHLSHYLTDNRDLLNGIAKHLNAAVEGSNFSFTVSPMQTKSTTLNVLHHTNRVGELHLSNKSLRLYSHFFHMGMGNQTQIEILEKRMQAEAETIDRFERELMKFKHSSPLKLKLLNIGKTQFLQMEDNIKNLKIEHEATKHELRATNEVIYDWWNTALIKYQDHKIFIEQIERLALTHNFKALLPEKNYQIFYRKQTNHSHSGFLTFEQGHISILSKDEWNLNELDQNLISFYYTTDEFEFLFNQIVHEPEVLSVKQDTLNGVPFLLIEFELGKMAITKNGFVTVSGQDLNLFHLIRFPAIRKALCLSYKERTEDDFTQSLEQASKALP